MRAAFGPPRPPREEEPGWRKRREVAARLRRIRTVAERRDLCTLPAAPGGEHVPALSWDGLGFERAPAPRTVPVAVKVAGTEVGCGGRVTRWGCDWRRHSDRVLACGSGRILGADGTWGPSRCRSPWCPTCAYRAGRARSARWVRRSQVLSEAAPSVRHGLVTLTCRIPSRPCVITAHEWRAGWRPIQGEAGEGVWAGPVDVADVLGRLQKRWRDLRQEARPLMRVPVGYLYGYESTASVPAIDAYADRAEDLWRCRACGEEGRRWWVTVDGRRQPKGPSRCPGCGGRQVPQEHIHIHVVAAVAGDPVAWGRKVVARWLEACGAEGVEAAPEAQDVREVPAERVAYVVAYPGTDPSVSRTDGAWAQWWAGVRGAHLWQAGGGWHRGTKAYHRAEAERLRQVLGWPCDEVAAALGRSWEEVPPSEDDGGWAAKVVEWPGENGQPVEYDAKEGTIIGVAPKPWTAPGMVLSIVRRTTLSRANGVRPVALWLRNSDGWWCELVWPERVMEALDPVPAPQAMDGPTPSPWEKPGQYVVEDLR